MGIVTQRQARASTAMIAIVNSSEQTDSTILNMATPMRESAGAAMGRLRRQVTVRFYKPGSRSDSAPSPVGAGTLQDGAGSCTLGCGAGWAGVGYEGTAGCTGTAGDGAAG